MAALEALDAGDGRPGPGGVLDWSLKLGAWLIERRGGRPASANVIGAGEVPPFPKPPEELALSLRVAGAAVAVGIARRPQDHNGMVDDAVTLVELISDSSVEIAGACAIAGFLSGLLDGWAMEGALAQSLFVAKRAEVFGAVKGPPVVEAIRDVFDEIYTGKRVPPPFDAAEAGASGAGGPFNTLGLPGHQLVAEALSLAYLCRNASHAISRGKIRGTDGRFLAAVAGMLAGAFAPETLPQEAWVGLEDQTPVLEVVEELLELRTSRYQRIRQYGDRFRRKKC